MKLGWSFCIVTAPGNDLVLKKCIDKILEEFKNSNNFEIIVIGNLTSLSLDERELISVIPFEEEIFTPSFSKRSVKNFVKTKSLRAFFYRSGAICHKKNKAAKAAQYDKLCIMHDYVGLETGWLEGYKLFGSEWDVCMNVVQNGDGTRHRDWMAWDHPALGKGENGEGACLIPYDKYTKYMYVSGAYFCVKTEFFLKNKLDETLFWGEGEDVEWSKRARELTRFKMNSASVVKYLKIKPENDAPNCESWKNNAVRLASILEN